MNKTAFHTRSSSPIWEPKYPFDLVVAYEDNTSRTQAVQLYDHLAQSLLDDYDFQCTWWNFDDLRNSIVMEEAADAAVEANMIILSLRTGEEMPTTAKNWVETWLARKDDRKSALVSLIGESSHQSRGLSPVRVYLQKVARLAKMDFFCHDLGELKAKAERAIQPVSTRATSLTPGMAEILEHSVTIPRWGINE